MDLDYTYRELSDIVQLDGPADDSDPEEEEEAPMEESDFLGLINAEAIRVLQEENCSDSNSISSSSDEGTEGELANVEDEVRVTFMFSLMFCLVYWTVWIVFVQL